MQGGSFWTRRSPRHARGDDRRPRAIARIDQTLPAQALEGLLIDRTTLALPDRRLVGGEAEPREILEDRVLEVTPAALSIVVLDAQQNAP